MLVQLSDTLPCETLMSPATSCNQPSRVGMLKLLETMADVNYVVLPICGKCITALAIAAGHAPTSETISAVTIKQVLSARLGQDGADEVLSELRGIGIEENDANADD